MKPCIFMGSSQRDLAAFPAEVRGEVGHALYEAQCGGEPLAAKAPRGFGGRDVQEIVASFESNAFRAVYTIRFENAVYVLHAFQKKAKRGSKTPKRDIDTIGARLKAAKDHYQASQ